MRLRCSAAEDFVPADGLLLHVLHCFAELDLHAASVILHCGAMQSPCCTLCCLLLCDDSIRLPEQWLEFFKHRDCHPGSSLQGFWALAPVVASDMESSPFGMCQKQQVLSPHDAGSNRGAAQ